MSSLLAIHHSTATMALVSQDHQCIITLWLYSAMWHGPVSVSMQKCLPFYLVRDNCYIGCVIFLSLGILVWWWHYLLMGRTNRNCFQGFLLFATKCLNWPTFIIWAFKKVTPNKLLRVWHWTNLLWFGMSNDYVEPNSSSCLWHLLQEQCMLLPHSNSCKQVWLPNAALLAISSYKLLILWLHPKSEPDTLASKLLAVTLDGAVTFLLLLTALIIPDWGDILSVTWLLTFMEICWLVVVFRFLSICWYKPFECYVT